MARHGRRMSDGAPPKPNSERLPARVYRNIQRRRPCLLMDR